MLDQPRRGKAGTSTEGIDLKPGFSDRRIFSLFRLGEWPNYYPGVKFPQDRASLEQLFRQATPNTGPYDIDVISDGVAAAFDKIGPSVLVSHSMGRTIGWFTGIKSRNVSAIVSYEPGGSPFLFPEGQVPEAVDSSYGLIRAQAVPLEDFKKLISKPIIIYYGDNLATGPSTDIGRDQWRVEMQMARKFAEVANSTGGDVQVVHLPEIGITGNTHFPFADLNNVEIADLLSKWLGEKGLDK